LAVLVFAVSFACLMTQIGYVYAQSSDLTESTNNGPAATDQALAGDTGGGSADVKGVYDTHLPERSQFPDGDAGEAQYTQKYNDHVNKWNAGISEWQIPQLTDKERERVDQASDQLVGLPSDYGTTSNGSTAEYGQAYKKVTGRDPDLDAADEKDFGAPITHVYDDRLATRPTPDNEFDQQIDTQAYQKNSEQRTANLLQEVPTVRPQEGWQDTMNQMKQGNETMAVQVYDSNQGKEYQLTRTKDGITAASDGDKFMIQEVIRNGDNNIQYKTIAPGSEEINLNSEGLKIRALMAKPGEDASKAQWSQQWEAGGLNEVNVLANWGRADTSNTFTELKTKKTE
jgi:hypothetical protein